MTPNRIAALVSVAAAVVTGILIPLLGVIESDIARAILLGTLVLVAGAIVIVWLIGWQKYEARRWITANKVIATDPAPPPVPPNIQQGTA